MNGLVAKEIRALLTPWLGCMVLVGAGAVVKYVVEAYLVLVFVGGACALGALSLGHEYMAATLASMLVQPVGRVRVLAVKTGVLAAMLLALCTLFSAVLPSGRNPKAGVVAVAVLCGLCLAPWFTILTRSPLAGAVFSISSLGMIWVLLNSLLTSATAGWAFWRIAAALGVAAVALTWRGFMRLEAIDGHGPHVHMAWDEASAAPRVRNAAWAVLRKELGLQQIPFVLAAIYVVGSLRLFFPIGDDVRDVLGGLTVLYSGLLALMIGSITSAEERQLGTLEWHQLLPMASWKQWALKAGTAIVLALALAIAVPGLIVFAALGPVGLSIWYVASVVVLTVVGMYASSLSSSSIRALLLSAAFPLVLLTIVAAGGARGVPRWHPTPFNIALLLAFVALLLWLAFDNHRGAERSARRVGIQLLVLGGCLALELVVGGLVVVG